MGSENNSIIPVIIDMQDFPAQAGKMVEACEEWGMFRIVNHEDFLPVSLMLEMKRVTRSLMERPEENQNHKTDVITGNGYFPPRAGNPLYDTLALNDMTSPQALEAFCKEVNASSDQDTIIKYSEAVNKLIIDVGKKLGEALGLKNFSVHVEGWPDLFRINRYKFTGETVGSSGMQIHSDTGFFTLLQDDDGYGGLEVMDKSGNYQLLEPMPATFLIIIGDIGTAWSNGRLKNVRHRVMCKQAGIRVSIATFVLGPRNALVEVPDEFVDSEHPRLYAPFLEEDYRKLRFTKKMLVGEALDLLRVGPVDSAD